MKKVVKYFGFALVIVLMTVAVLTYLAPHFGWRVDVVASGSREPYFSVGSLVVIRPVSPEAVKAGDIVAFKPMAGKTLIIHRVVSIEKGSLYYFVTRGNDSGSSGAVSLPARNMVGKICFHVPYVGYVTEFLKTPWGFLVGLVIPGLIVIAVYVRSIWKVLSKKNG